MIYEKYAGLDRDAVNEVDQEFCILFIRYRIQLTVIIQRISLIFKIVSDKTPQPTRVAAGRYVNDLEYVKWMFKMKSTVCQLDP